MPAIDFTTVKALEPVPVGVYNATIIEAIEGLSNNQNPKIDMKWRIEGGKMDGRVIFDALTFTPQTLFRVKATLLGLGFPKEWKGDVTTDLLVGKSAQITVDIQQSTQVDETGEPYPPRNRIKKVRPLNAPAATATKK